MLTVIYWLKFIFFYFLSKIRHLVSSTTTSGFGKTKVFTIVEKEQVRNLLKDGFTIDASYFNGFDFNGRFLGFGMQKRLDGRCESVFFIRVPEISADPLVLPINPSTWTTHVIDEWKTDKGLRFEMKEPMERWNVLFDGEVIDIKTRKSFQLKLALEWNRKSATFDTDTDMDSVLIAKTIASQQWSRQFFNNLKELHQSHYEIFGDLCGSLSIDDQPSIDLKFLSMKDRSYGKHRNWGDFRRYILHYLGTEDGLYIGCHFVSIYKTFDHLVVGFIVDQRGKKVAIRHCSQTLSDIGQEALPFVNPYSFECIDVEGTVYKINIRIAEKIKFFCGEDRCGTLFSAYVNGTVNGIRMAGMCEYEYNSKEFATLLDTEKNPS